MSDHITIKITRRPWYEWVLWALWLALEIFILQNAIASTQELEPRAAAIFWMSFVVLLLAGAIVWFVRKPRPRRVAMQDSVAAKPVKQV